MKEEDTMDGIDSTVSLTMSKNRITLINKLHKWIDALRSVADVDLMEKDRRGIGEDMSRKTDVVPADPAIGIRRDQNDDQAESDAFRSNHMKDMTKLIKNVLKPGAQGPLFCFAFKLTIS